MPVRSENHFTCDLKNPDGSPGCEVDFYYNPGGPPPQPRPEWPPEIELALTKAVAITIPLTGYTTFYCCDQHAIDAMNLSQHLPPLPPKIQGATEADLRKAREGMKIVNGMKSGQKPS